MKDLKLGTNYTAKTENTQITGTLISTGKTLCQLYIHNQGQIPSLGKVLLIRKDRLQPCQNKENEKKK